jgi:hypothetical protein
MQPMPRLKSDGRSPYAAGQSTNLSAAKQAVFDLLSPHVGTGEVCWFEVDGLPTDRPKPRRYLKGQRDVIPADFRWVCRMTGRELAVGYSGYVPWVMTDEVTGKPIMMVGEGGIFPNTMSDLGSDLICPSIVNGLGDELNNTDMFSPGSHTVAAVMRIPAPSTVMNGITFGTVTGGAILGGSSSTSNNNFAMYTDISGSPGMFRFRNQIGVNGVEGVIDYRDASLLKIKVQYDDAADLYTWYVNRNGSETSGTVSSATNIPAADAEARKLHVFAVKNSPPALSFFGACACIIRAPAALLATSANRDIFNTYMDEVA